MTFDSRPATHSESFDQTSAAIGIARLICILGIVYVHAWTGLPGAELMALNDSPQGVLRWGLMEFLGRSAVPLLGMISGWLVMGSVRKRSWTGFMAGKARTILAPMVLWNIIAILFVSGAAYAGLIEAPMPATWRWTINELLGAATPNEINVQMPFLRDLFICMAAAPLLARLPGAALGAVAVAALGWSISGLTIPLLLRPPILFFFALGMLARRHKLLAWLASRPLAVMAIPYVALAVAKIWFETVGAATAAGHPTALAVVDLAMRAAAGLFLWSIAWRLASSRAAALLLRVEPYAFLIFCAHLIMIWLAGPLIGTLTGPLGSPLYPLFLLLQPALVLLATIVLGRLLLIMAPAVALMLSGGRLKSVARVRCAQTAEHHAWHSRAWARPARSPIV